MPRLGAGTPTRGRLCRRQRHATTGRLIHWHRPSAAATGFAAAHRTDLLVWAKAALEGYSTAYWWAAVLFPAGLVISFLLYPQEVPARFGNVEAAPVAHM
jgi:hypothetical protein